MGKRERGWEWEGRNENRREGGMEEERRGRAKEEGTGTRATSERLPLGQPIMGRN